ncbi:MAG: hypothetical protein P1V51_17765 [Deltaproteobacteria bacterium]|nr:hypothetical protein [Deltaproteobacteria bacterium]
MPEGVTGIAAIVLLALGGLGCLGLASSWVVGLVTLLLLVPASGFFAQLLAALARGRTTKGSGAASGRRDQ